jgi:cytochrome P450
MGSQTNPPGPSSKTLLSLIPGSFQNPAEFLLDLKREYGDITCLRLGIKNVYLIGSAEYAEDILETRQEEFSNWVAWFIKSADILQGEGLLATESEGHTARRSLVEPVFVRENICKYSAVITSYGVRQRELWTDGRPSDMEKDMGRLTLGIALKMLFDLDLGTDGKEIGDIMDKLLFHYSAVFPPVLLAQPLLRHIPHNNVRGLIKEKNEISKIIYGIIGERRTDSTDRGDLLSSMIAARSENKELREMTDTQIMDECISMLLAGHDPVAKALTWTWYLLSQNPEAEKSLHDEIDTVLGSRIPGLPDMDILPYTESVFREAMRLYPPVWMIIRQSLGEFEIGGYSTPKGSLFLVSPYILQRDPRYYPDPLSFKPERWKGRNENSGLSYFPFGGGRRICTGEPMSWIQGVLLIAVIAQRWSFGLDPGHVVEPKPQITLGTKHGVTMVPRKRAL